MLATLVGLSMLLALVGAPPPWPAASWPPDSALARPAGIPSRPSPASTLGRPVGWPLSGR